MNLLLRMGIILLLPFFIQKQITTESKVQKIERATYCNSRYSFCLDYPISILSEKILGDNGDGIVLTPKEDDLTVTVSGSWNVSQRSSKVLYDDFIKEKLEGKANSNVRYVIVEEDYYEVTYLLEGRYYYLKSLNRGNKHIQIQIEVPEADYQSLKRMKKELIITE